MRLLIWSSPHAWCGGWRMTAELGRSSMSIAAFLAALFVLMPDIAISMQDDPCKPAWEVGPFFPPGVDRSGSVMAVFDDGRGEALYVAGDLISAGGRQVSLIGRWDGQRWESVEDASGLGLGGGGVAALAVYDDGRGPALYAAGSFDRAGGQFVRGIARWDGAQWEPLEGPLGIGVEGTAQAMAVYDPGDGARPDRDGAAATNRHADAHRFRSAERKLSLASRESSSRKASLRESLPSSHQARHRATGARSPSIGRRAASGRVASDRSP